MSRSSTTRPSKRYVGDEPPVIKHITNEEPLSYSSEHEAKCAEGDYMPMDDQGFDEFREDE